MKPHILYLSSYLPKRSETFVYREVLGLRERGMKVSVASLYQPEANLGDVQADALAAESVTVYPAGIPKILTDAFLTLLASPLRAIQALLTATRDVFLASDLGLAARCKIPIQYLAALALVRRVANRGITAVHVHMAHAPATVGMMAAAVLGVPFSFTGHAADLFRERGLLEEKLRRARFVACISEWHRQWYNTICKRPDAEYPIIRCGVEIPEKIVGHSPGNTIRLLGLGRLVPKKGFDALIAATAELLVRNIPVHCIIAGDGPERQRLEAQATGLHCIKFIGSVDHPRVPALLAETDIFVMPCRVAEDGDRDGIPVVLMEAMAGGIPVVTGDLPTIRELVQDGKTGCLVAPGDAEQLADVLAELAADPVRRQELGRNGRARVIEEFSSTVNLARIEFALTS